MIDFKEYFLLELEEAYKTFREESKKIQNNKHSDPKVRSSKKKIKNNKHPNSYR
jgi:hypothetical protein